jgi:hypothetical protein
MSFVASRTRSSICLFRRQSSAHEFSQSGASASALSVSSGSVTNTLRRQSSAFEVAQRNRPQAPIYENLTRATAARASLKRRNSSVKDLILKLEKTKRPSPPSTPPRRRTPSASSSKSLATAAKPEFAEVSAAAAPADEWVDASEFFKNPLPPPTSGAVGKRQSAIPKHMQQQQQTQEEASTSGCKRSSIIRIRQENKGKVFKSVETFMKPNQLGSITNNGAGE